MSSSEAAAIFFSGASGIQIDRSTFTAVHGNVSHYDDHRTIVNHAELGWNALGDAIAPGAIHNADERSCAAKCHPKTRTELLDMVKSWVVDPNATSDIVWLHGSTGVGKTAIAQSVSEWAYAEKLLGGSYFFLRGKPEQEEARFLFPTIAYQLALQVPGLRDHINYAMSIDPILPHRDLETQLKCLIIQPFEALAYLPESPLLVVIDGVDECGKPDSQEAIIHRIGQLVETLRISLRFLITSRPEVHIRKIFDDSALFHKTRRIVLDRQFEPDHDVRTFLTDGFAKIYAKVDFMETSNIIKPWPSPEVIEALVAKSSGQFIYASTVLKFVGEDWHIPAHQLRIVLDSSPAHSKIFKNLDERYSQILQRCPYRDDLVRTLGLMLCFHCPQPPEVYDDLLGFSHGHTYFILRGMHSLVKFPDDLEDANERYRIHQNQEYDATRGLRLHHASFSDFLTEPSRAKGFFVDLPAMHAHLVKAGFQMFAQCVAEPWSETPRSIPPSPETWGYLKNHLPMHLSKCRENDKKTAIQRLENFNPTFSAAKPPRDASWNVAFDAIHSLVTTLIKALACYNDVHAPSYLHSEHSHWAQDVPFESILPFDRDSVGDKALLELSLKYCKVLDDYYHFALSETPDMMKDLLARLPGLTILQDPFPVDCLQDIFGVSQNVILADIERNRIFLHRWGSLHWNHVHTSNSGGALEVVVMNPHMSNFLSDLGRSGSHYQHPENTHVNACRNLIGLISSREWLQTEKKDGALSCLEQMLKIHLDALNVDPSTSYADDHPMVALITQFGHIICDISYLDIAPLANVKLIWSATRRVLDWIQRQKLKVLSSPPQSRKLEDLLVRVNSQIYRQILRIQPSEGDKTQTITLYEPFLLCVDPRRFSSMSTSFSQDVGTIKRGTAGYRPLGSIRISEALLALHALRCSLLDFLTQEDCAGPFYIPADAYHTQFAEICLGHCDPPTSDITGDWRILPAYTEWRFHLDRAQPSARLLHRLQSVGVGRWLAGDSPNGANVKETYVKSIMGIIEWLDKLSTKPPSLLEHWNEMLKGLEGTEQRKTLARKRKMTSRYGSQSSIIMP